VLGQPLDPVQRALDRVGVERRQRLGREEVGVVDEVDHRVVDVEPLGHLARGDQVDAAHPRGEEVEAAEGVAQLVVGDEPRLAAGLACLGGAADPGQPALARGVPRGVAAVDPGVDDVDGEADLADRRRGHQREGRHRDALDLHLDGGEPGGHPVGVGVAARPDQLAGHRALPELHLDRAPLPEHARAAVGLGPRLDADRRGHAAAQLGTEAGDGAAALVPAVELGVAQ
jgi:hypothetical protein